VTAALGLLATDMVYEYVSTVYQRFSTSMLPRSRPGSRSSRQQARGQLEEDGVPPTDADPARRRLPLPRPGLRAPRRRRLGRDRRRVGEKVRADFHDIHEREYSRRFEDSDIEIPNIRVRGIGLMPPLEVPEVERATRRRRRAPLRARRLVPRRRRAAQVPTRFYDRAALKAGNRSRPGDRQPVRLDDGDPAGLTARSTASGTSSSRSQCERRCRYEP
jgi:N-methylhydantoinase A/oxoprolinase/acetone carboxylase beta subunit